jgi:hypothetical protein
MRLGNQALCLGLLEFGTQSWSEGFESFARLADQKSKLFLAAVLPKM